MLNKRNLQTKDVVFCLQHNKKIEIHHAPYRQLRKKILMCQYIKIKLFSYYSNESECTGDNLVKPPECFKLHHFVFTKN